MTTRQIVLARDCCETEIYTAEAGWDLRLAIRQFLEDLRARGLDHHGHTSEEIDKYNDVLLEVWHQLPADATGGMMSRRTLDPITDDDLVTGRCDRSLLIKYLRSNKIIKPVTEEDVIIL